MGLFLIIKYFLKSCCGGLHKRIFGKQFKSVFTYEL